MSFLIPETLTRLQSVVFVRNEELKEKGGDPIIRVFAEKLAEQALRKIIRDFIKTEVNTVGCHGQTLSLDVYVLSPEDLHKIVADAIKIGERDAMRWGGRV